MQTYLTLCELSLVSSRIDWRIASDTDASGDARNYAKLNMSFAFQLTPDDISTYPRAHDGTIRANCQRGRNDSAGCDASSSK